MERNHVSALTAIYLLLNIEGNLGDQFEKILKIKLLPFRSSGIIWNTVHVFELLPLRVN